MKVLFKLNFLRFCYSVGNILQQLSAIEKFVAVPKRNFHTITFHFNHLCRRCERRVHEYYNKVKIIFINKNG